MAFQINQLNLPEPIRPTPIDFRPLSEVGDVIAASRRKQQIADTLTAATDPQGNLDVERAGTALAKIGLLDEARPILALAQQKAALAQQTAYQQGMLGLGQQREQREATQPMVVPFGAGVMRRTGEFIREPDQMGLLDEATVKTMAEQLRAGDTSVLTNLGRGAQGAQNVVRVRQEAQRQNAAAGTSGTEQAHKQAEFFGEKAGQRVLGGRAANIELPAAEFQQMAPLALQASQAVNRTQYPTLNSVILAWQKGTGDENVVRFAVGANTLANIYARAVSPTGVPTDELRRKGNALLEQAYSQGQFGAAVDMMQQEIAAARRAPGSVRQQMRETFTGQPTAAPPPPPPLGQVKIPMDAANHLRANPNLRDAFDAKYGAGASDRVLGPRR